MVRSHSLHFKSFRPIRESEVIILRNKFKTIHRMSSSNLLIFPFDAKFTFDKDNLAELLFQCVLDPNSHSITTQYFKREF